MAYSLSLKRLISVGMLVTSIWSSWPSAAAEESAALGPLFSQFSLTFEPGERSEIAGPFFSFESKDSEKGWGLHPLLFHQKGALTDFEEFDFVYPLFTYDRFGEEKRFQLFQLLSFAGGQGNAGHLQSRFTLFPIYFQQRSPDPALNYTAFLPFYGDLKNRFFRDEVHFVMFPFYVQTRKKDVITDNYVLPFFHVRRGEALHGWQFWPLVGMEHKDPTIRTNVLDEAELIGGHDQLFVLWPFFFRNTLGVGTTNVQTQNLLLPFYSIQRSAARDSTTYLWPLGFTLTVDREKKYREWGSPWPLIVFARGEGKTVNRVWPLFGQAKNPYLESDFYAWPLYKYNRATADPLDRERRRILFFLYSDLTERNTQAKTALRRTDLWPLFTARRDHDGNERFQLLAPLEPFLPNNKSIERNYSPVWSVWRSEKNAKSGQRSESLLWNFYRGEATSTNRKCSLFFGLFRYQSDADGQRWRLFGAPMSRPHKRPDERSQKP
ncbi:MAG: hypothetical protein L0Z50_22050 [Verrucomicrobiales bacterium]|nr:hypothetical protein [Verrucomicrobiales bacterium]